MRIFGFSPYGIIRAEKVIKDTRQDPTLMVKISKEIAANEAIRLALLAISDQEKEKKRHHHFKLLSQKQANVLLSQLRHLHLDFSRLRSKEKYDRKGSQDSEEKKERKKKHSVQVVGKKKKISIGTSASQAIAAAAEAWVIARNQGILDMASMLFYQKDNEES
ncbi:hypothetical protein [Candidatus Chlamydia sanziniae]|nr:hypothetical protein [Candidatus Chlamydia sanziniae]